MPRPLSQSGKNCSATPIKDDHTIDVDMFKKAVFTLMYNEPHLRSDADLSVTPALWVPATDFSDAFHFEDLRESGRY